MKIVGVQMDVTLGDVQSNLKRIDECSGKAKELGARLVVFPECAITGYCFNSKEEALPYSTPVPGEHVDALVKIAAKHDLHIVAGSLESSGNELFNVALCVSPAGLSACYRKTHLPHLGVDHFTSPGGADWNPKDADSRDPYPVFEVDGVRVGVLICYDASFPEASRILTLKGADLIVLPTNWPPGAEPTADYVINARASENKVYYISVNRIGHERGFDFIGKSKICDVHGNTLEFADHQKEQMLSAEIDEREARDKRIQRTAGHWVDRLADRRPELYGRVCETPRST